MSAFLGPIHYWLFRKIQFQDKVTNTILECYKDKFPKLKEQLIEKHGKLESEPLENIIDGSNIHGWLQERVSLVEYTYAETVNTIIKNNQEEIKHLENLMYQIGKDNSLSNLESAIEVYKYFNDLFLDGMPCDRANSVVSQDEKEVVVKRETCVHVSYWTDVCGDISTYYLLRDSLIKGILFDSKFVYEKINDDSYAIRRK